MSENKSAEWAALQAAYVASSRATSDMRYELDAKYGNARFASSGEIKRYEALQARSHKAYERVYAWLGRNSPWDWSCGASIQWVCTKLTFEQAISEAAPVLPPESMCYGWTTVATLQKKAA